MSAILVETKRVDGEPRQRYIAYLGGVTDERSLWARCRFWKQVSTAFDRLRERVPTAERQRFEAAIAVKVPPRTPVSASASPARKCGAGASVSPI